MLYEFGNFRVDAANRILWSKGKRVSVPRLVFELLLFLVRNTGRSVTKRELMEALWPGTFVTPNNLPVTVSALRRLLQADGNRTNYLLALPGHGYRFEAAVRERYPEAERLRRMRGRSSTIRSIAVLPFQVIGEDTREAYLGVGMADALMAAVCRVPGLAVRSPAAVFMEHRGWEVLSIGERLGVDAVIATTIQKTGDRIRVIAQLIRVTDGVALWVEKLDESLTDLFVVEDLLGRRVFERLLAMTNRSYREGLEVSISGEAHRAYLKGRYLSNRRTLESLERSIWCFERVIELEPRFAPGHVGLADACILSVHYGALPPKMGYPRAKAAAERALELNDTLAAVHTSLACYHLYYGWQWKDARDTFKRAIDLDPQSPKAHHWYSEYLWAMGRFDEALEELTEAENLDPLSLMVNTTMGLAYFYSRRYDRGIEQLQRTLELDPYFGLAHWVLGLVYEQKGMVVEAVARFKEASRLSGGTPLILGSLARAHALAGQRRRATGALRRLNGVARRSYVCPYRLATVHAALGDRGEVFRLLDAAFEARSCWLTYLNVDPAFDQIRANRRFTDLVKRVGLPTR